MVKQNKIVVYYSSDDKRLDDYYKEHSRLLGLDKQLFGIDEYGVLRFESKPSHSKVWQDYRLFGGSDIVIGDLNKIWINFYDEKYTLDEIMQFYREFGSSLSHMVDVFSEKFNSLEDKKSFEKALIELEDIEHFEVAKKDFLENIFLAHLNGTEDESVISYRKEAKKIISRNFGEGAWKEFVDSIKTKYER